MRPMTEQQVRRSFVNCSGGEAQGLTLPKGFAELDWVSLDLLGWRDPKAPLRGYLVLDAAAGPVGLAVRAADSRMSSGTAVMCLQQRDPTEVVAERAAELRERAEGFLASVRS